MNLQILYIAIYRALECLQKETGNEEMLSYMADANPYIFMDRKSADPAVYSEFNDWVNASGIDVDKNNSYEIAKSYIAEKTDYISYFEAISVEEWNELIDIIAEEEPQLK